MQAAGLVRRLSTATNRYVDRIRRDLEMTRSDLTAMEMIATRSRSRDPMSPSELAAALQLSASAVTSLVDRLEAMGHVRRDRRSDDRRRQSLIITDTAAEISGAAFAPLSRAVRTALGRMSDDELVVVERAMREVLSELELLQRTSDSEGAGAPVVAAPIGSPPD